MDIRRRRHHTEAHLLECCKGAWHMGPRGDEETSSPAMLFEDGGGVDGIFPRISAFGFQDQGRTRCTELNQKIGDQLRLGDDCRLPRQISS